MLRIDKSLDKDNTGEGSAALPAKTQSDPPACCMTPRDALNAPSGETALENALGRISAEYVVPYPPGVPLIVPGERITAEVLRMLSVYMPGKRTLRCVSDG